MISKDKHNQEYYFNIAKAVAEGSTCYLFKEGAILVNNKGKIISSGHNGAVHGCIDCWKNGVCSYEAQTGQKSDCSQEQCMGLHAEIDALLNARREETPGSTLYVWAVNRHTGEPVKIRTDGIAGHIIQACDVKEIITEGVVP